MFAFEILARRGTWVLLRFTAALLLLVLLHLARIPVVLLARVLEGVMRRLDGYGSRLLATAASGPINQFVTPATHPAPTARGAGVPVMGGAR